MRLRLWLESILSLPSGARRLNEAEWDWMRLNKSITRARVLDNRLPGYVGGIITWKHVVHEMCASCISDCRNVFISSAVWGECMYNCMLDLGTLAWLWSASGDFVSLRSSIVGYRPSQSVSRCKYFNRNKRVSLPTITRNRNWRAPNCICNYDGNVSEEILFSETILWFQHSRQTLARRYWASVVSCSTGLK